jgi:hypothetical protein
MTNLHILAVKTDRGYDYVRTAHDIDKELDRLTDDLRILPARRVLTVDGFGNEYVQIVWDQPEK